MDPPEAAEVESPRGSWPAGSEAGTTDATTPATSPSTSPKLGRISFSASSSLRESWKPCARVLPRRSRNSLDTSQLESALAALRFEREFQSVGAFKAPPPSRLLGSLPSELVYKILDSCNNASLYNLALTCRSLRHPASEALFTFLHLPHFVKGFSVRDVPTDTLRHRLTKTHTLRCDDFGPWPQWFYSSKMQLTGLRKATVSGPRPKVLEAIARIAPAVEEVAIDRATWPLWLLPGEEDDRPPTVTAGPAGPVKPGPLERIESITSLRLTTFQFKSNTSSFETVPFFLPNLVSLSIINTGDGSGTFSYFGLDFLNGLTALRHLQLVVRAENLHPRFGEALLQLETLELGLYPDRSADPPLEHTGAFQSAHPRLRFLDFTVVVPGDRFLLRTLFEGVCAGKFNALQKINLTLPDGGSWMMDPRSQIVGLRPLADATGFEVEGSGWAWTLTKP